MLLINRMWGDEPESDSKKMQATYYSLTWFCNVIGLLLMYAWCSWTYLTGLNSFGTRIPRSLYYCVCVGDFSCTLENTGGVPWSIVIDQDLHTHTHGLQLTVHPHNTTCSHFLLPARPPPPTPCTHFPPTAFTSVLSPFHPTLPEQWKDAVQTGRHTDLACINKRNANCVSELCWHL